MYKLIKKKSEIIPKIIYFLNLRVFKVFSNYYIKKKSLFKIIEFDCDEMRQRKIGLLDLKESARARERDGV